MISLQPCPPARQPLTHGARACDADPPLHNVHDLQEALVPRRLPSILERLLDAPSAEECQRRVADIVQSMGFDWLGYGRVQVSGDRVLPISLSATHGDDAWQRRYIEKGYLAVDLRLHEALRTSLPCVWHIDELARASAPDQALLRRFVADLRATGMSCGVMLALPVAQPHERVLISLLSHRADMPAIDDDQLFSRVLTLGLCLHEYYTHYAAPADDVAPSVALSDTQRAILQCLASGLADKQIADRLGLSLHAVDYHMRQLRKRFGARNRMQLLPQALRAVQPM
ncbi:MAG TPA: LuxR family transcriptional regulator [Albitalea sp.]|nr:LuxR family transcriptional regulator [Albitalea sp.]